MKKKLAIIGASTGQLPLCLKAKEIGLETYCFAWPKDAVCQDVVDHFIPISIFEMDEIVRLCREYQIDGVVSNASEATAAVVSYVAGQLGKPCTPYATFLHIQNKEWVRQATNGIEGLGTVACKVGKFHEVTTGFPCPYVLKPIKGSSKKGVNFVSSADETIELTEDLKEADFMAEQYIEGQEYSVETLSFENRHYLVQITEKIGTGAPHFVELEHHQPAVLSDTVSRRIGEVIPKILSTIGYTHGAAHIEIKVDSHGNVFLIEVNPRGGGDYISNELVGLSTDYDYLGQMIQVALGDFQPMPVHHTAYAGIYFLSAHTRRLLPHFEGAEESWMVKRVREEGELTVSCSNYDRNGYIIYCSNQKITL